MTSLGSVLRSVAASIMRTTTRRSTLTTPPSGSEDGWNGPTATVEVFPSETGRVTMAYVPSTDGDPDPGEIVWTWVPYEERDGRGKDRPVLIVATEPTGTVIAVQLTSKPHDGDADFVEIGRGRWDADGRPSWVSLERIFRVHPGGMRREAAALDRESFERVADALSGRFGWR